MPRNTCSICGEPQRQKMASLYWAWTWPTGDRRAYKQLLDRDCSAPLLNRVVYSLRKPDDCVVCNEPVSTEDEVVVWLTLYVPGQERRDCCLVHHIPCFEMHADEYSRGAQRLADRSGSGVGGPPPRTPASRWDTWDQMGITPA